MSQVPSEEPWETMPSCWRVLSALMICMLSRPAIWYAASVVSAGATGERPVRPSLCRSHTCWSTSAGWGAAVGSS
eukprot:668991-Pyramimonas_sp.AAC.1